MMTAKDIRMWLVVVVIYLVGLAGFLIPSWRDTFIGLIPYNIIFAFIVLLLGEEKITLSTGILFVVCFLFGYLIELLGTRTGLIFGEYAYGDGLGIKVLDVPLLIGMNWFFMVYTSLVLVAGFTHSKWTRMLLAPCCMVVYDYFLEPFAMKNDMWRWADDVVPPQNYLAWYLGGLFLCAVAVYGNFRLRNRFASGLFVIQMLFFVVLYLFL